MTGRPGYFKIHQFRPRFRRKYSSRTFIIPVAVFTLAYNVPKFLEIRVATVCPEEHSNSGDCLGGGEAIYTIEPTDMRTDPAYIRVYILWMNLIVQIVVPFALLVFLNIGIFRRVKQLEARIARNSVGFAHAFSTEEEEKTAKRLLGESQRGEIFICEAHL